jgi:predicted DNA binding CopG/RHH family protein
MSKLKPPRGVAARTPKRTPHEELAQEAADWDNRRRTPSGFVDDPSAVPRAQEATAISIRMPNALLVLLKKFAEREGVGYQVLIKRWLDDRVRAERESMRAHRDARSASRGQARAPRFPLIDRDGDRGHYQQG